MPVVTQLRHFACITHRGMYEGEELWQDATRLAAERPLVVSLDDVDVRFLYEQDLPRAQVGHAINGAVVGLACSAAEGQEGSAEGALPPPPTCLGIGVVRAVDMRARLLYILTDLAHRNERRLQKVDTLLVRMCSLCARMGHLCTCAAMPVWVLLTASHCCVLLVHAVIASAHTAWYRKGRKKESCPSGVG